jgi:hypothetical protein
VARLRPQRVMRPHPCGADCTSCVSGGTRDVATGRSGGRPYAGKQVDKRGRLSSLSAVHNHSRLARLEGLPRRRSGSRLHDLRFHGPLEHRESDPRQRQEIARQRGHLSVAHLGCAAELGGRRPDVRLGFTDCQSHVPRGRLRLRQRRSTLIEDSKQGLHNRYFTGGGWT